MIHLINNNKGTRHLIDVNVAENLGMKIKAEKLDTYLDLS